MFLQLLANGLSVGAVYAIVALGFGLIYNTTGIFHFAHGVIYTIAAYILYSFLIQVKFNLYASILFSIVITSIIGILIEVIVYSPLRNKKVSSSTYIISSLGVYVLLQNLIALLFGNETKVLFSGTGKTFIIGSVIITRIQLYEIIIFIIVASIFFIFLERIKLGKIVRAVANDTYLAELVGLDVKSIRILVFAAGSFLAAIGAVLVSMDVGMDPHMGLSMVLLSAVAVIVGGTKVFFGAALGGLLLGLIENLILLKFSACWQDLFTFVILILFLMFRPQGLLGKKRRIEEI